MSERLDDMAINKVLRQMKHIVVNKEVLLSFYSHPVSSATEEEIAEVVKVINLVLSIHFGKYYSYFDDLRSQALMTIMERHDRYDSAYPPLGFCYTMARNEAGNLLRKLIKEDGLETVGFSRGGRVKEVVPTELSDLLLYMSGDKPFVRLVVPTELAGALLIFCERGVSKYSGDVSKERVIDLLLNSILIK